MSSSSDGPAADLKEARPVLADRAPNNNPFSKSWPNRANLLIVEPVKISDSSINAESYDVGGQSAQVEQDLDAMLVRTDGTFHIQEIDLYNRASNKTKEIEKDKEKNDAK